MPILEPDINASRRAFIACGLAGGVALTLPIAASDAQQHPGLPLCALRHEWRGGFTVK